MAMPHLPSHLADRAGRVKRRPGVANQISVEALPRAHAAGKLAAVAQVHRDRVVGMARRNNHRRLHLAVAHAELDDVVFFQAQLAQRRAGNDRRIVPAQVRDRLGQLLQPAHIVPAAVVDIRIGPEDDFERILRRRAWAQCTLSAVLPGAAFAVLSKAVSAIQPSCSALRQPVSKSPLISSTASTSRAPPRTRSASARSAASGKHRAPSARRRADRSSAAQSKPCRRRHAHPTKTPDNARQEYASATAAPSRRSASRDAPRSSLC